MNRVEKRAAARYRDEVSGIEDILQAYRFLVHSFILIDFLTCKLVECTRPPTPRSGALLLRASPPCSRTQF